MSEQRFTNIFRECLWLTYSEKCFYCQRPLAFSVMKIDHVIPESLKSKHKELNSLKTRLGLPNDFDVLGFENLVPSCEDCNKNKSDIPLADGALMIQLAQVKKKVPLLEERLQKKGKERSLDQTLRCIIRSVEAEKFTDEDLIKHLEFYRKHPNGISGSSGNAPPASPEERAWGMHIAINEGIIWTDESMNELQKLNLDAEHINNLIFNTVISRSKFEIKKLNGTDFILRFMPNYRITFRLTDKGVMVLSIYSK